MQVLLDLFAFVLNRASQISQHLLVEPDHSVVAHLVFHLSALLRAQLERTVGLLSQVALTQSLLARGSVRLTPEVPLQVARIAYVVVFAAAVRVG